MEASSTGWGITSCDDGVAISQPRDFCPAKAKPYVLGRVLPPPGVIRCGEKDYDDPIAWTEWIVAYTGWTEEEWTDFYSDWTADSADRIQVAVKYGVNIFDWSKVGGSYGGETDMAVLELNRQMEGMSDITMIAHSKGGMVAKGFMDLSQNGSFFHPKWIGAKAVPVDNYILIEPAINQISTYGGAILYRGAEYYAKATVPVITINNTPDIRNVASWVRGRIAGAYNIQSRKSEHSLMVEYAQYATAVLPSLRPQGPAGYYGPVLGW